MTHVTDINGNRVDIYFPEDGKERANVRLLNIKPVNPKSPEPRRADLIGKSFYFDEDDDLPHGDWTVHRMVGNTYYCVCNDRTAVKNCETFDIGYVINCYKRDQQQQRERCF